MARGTEWQTEAGACGSGFLPSILCVSRRKIKGPAERGQRGRKWESLRKFPLKQLSEQTIHWTGLTHRREEFGVQGSSLPTLSLNHFFHRCSSAQITGSAPAHRAVPGASCSLAPSGAQTCLSVALSWHGPRHFTQIVKFSCLYF